MCLFRGSFISLLETQTFLFDACFNLNSPGAMLGMLQGKSMTANWTEYRFVLTPSTAALKPSTLEYFEITAPPIGVEETNPEQQISAEEDTSPEPHSVLLVLGSRALSHTPWPTIC